MNIDLSHADPLECWKVVEELYVFAKSHRLFFDGPGRTQPPMLPPFVPLAVSESLASDSGRRKLRSMFASYDKPWRDTALQIKILRRAKRAKMPDEVRDTCRFLAAELCSGLIEASSDK